MAVGAEAGQIRISPRRPTRASSCCGRRPSPSTPQATRRSTCRCPRKPCGWCSSRARRTPHWASSKSTCQCNQQPRSQRLEGRGAEPFGRTWSHPDGPAMAPLGPIWSRFPRSGRRRFIWKLQLAVRWGASRASAPSPNPSPPSSSRGGGDDRLTPPRLHDATIYSEPLHIAGHLTFIAAGLVLYWPVLQAHLGPRTPGRGIIW